MLSPLNLSGIFSRLLTPKPRGRVIEVTYYRCPDCAKEHDDEDDAVKCCAIAPSADTDCPVCDAAYGESNYPFRDAADCYLWKDITAPERWRIANAVEAGSTWAAELKIKHPALGAN